MAKGWRGKATAWQPSEDDLTPSDPRGLSAVLVRGFTLALRAGWRPRLRSEASITTYGYGVRSLIGFLAARRMPIVTEATREHVQEWVIDLRTRAEPKTIHLYLLAARIFFAWLIEEEERRDNPTDRIHAPKPDQRVNDPFTPAEIDALFGSQNNKTLTGARNRALFAVLLDTGLRREECASMQMGGIDWTHGTIKVLGKGARERRVRIGAAAQRMVDAYLRARTRHRLPDGGALWVTVDGRPLSGVRLWGIHADLGRRLGFPIHPHRWRHTNAQSLLDSGMDRESVRELLGHASLETLRDYTAATDARRALEAHRLHSPMDRLGRGHHARGGER